MDVKRVSVTVTQTSVLEILATHLTELPAISRSQMKAGDTGFEHLQIINSDKT